MFYKRSIAFIVIVLYLITFLLLLPGCAGSNKNKIPPQDITDTMQNQTGQKPVGIEWNPISFEKLVKPYKVKRDLSNIENIRQFGEFTPEQRDMLAKNGFVVTPSTEEQLFYIYEKNEYLKIPSFITTDSVLHTYHVFFDYSLRNLEYGKLLGLLEQLTDSMLKKSMENYKQIKNPDVKTAALKNTAYFAVAQMALKKKLPDGMPQEAKIMAEKEYSLISRQGGFERSAIFPYELDYSQFVPRGHYTRNEDFKRYFQSMIWYGQVPFPLYIEKNGQKELNVEQTIQALLISHDLFLNSPGTEDADLWNKIYEPTTFYVGSTDDLNVNHYRDLLIKVYGAKPNLEELTDPQKLSVLEKEALKLPEPKIKAKWITVDTPVGKQFRFMGQRYIPDSEILQELVEPYERPMPKGLDVMGVLGSERAYTLLIEKFRENQKWEKYTQKFAGLRDRFSKLPDGTWRSNMYYGWLWVLKSVIGRFGEGYPSFMTNEAWEDKSLSTALGSWSELRHDTILYGKQSGAECGDEIHIVKGYVEPNVQVYEKLLWLTGYSRTNLEAKGILPDDLRDRMSSFEDLLDFLIQCSVKELRNEELTTQDYERLVTYGAMLESMTSSFAEVDNLRWFEITSETDKNMAVIADVHTVPGSYLEEGVGPASEIFVVVPVNGKLYLTRGAIFSYYEFVSEKRLTDEEWQRTIKEKKQPPLPEWTRSFIIGKKPPIPAPRLP